MTPRNFARPAAAGPLCFAFMLAGAQAAPAQNETTTETGRAAQEPQIGLHHRNLNVRAGRRATVGGKLSPAVAGVTVVLHVKRGRGWERLDRDRTTGGGRFKLRQRLRRTGSGRVRVSVAGAQGVLPAERRVGRLNVFRSTNASWYGPGLYGNRTGCGGTLHAGRLGVAHKSLPCGTKVTFKHRGRELRVPVIDRGPYVAGREYDLTAATARRLGFEGHGAILATR